MKKILILLLLLPSSAFANVVINEIAWMGTQTSASDEWIELYSDIEIDLTGWTLEATDGSPKISLEGTINGYFLLERTDDESVLNISADQIYSGSLENGEETLELRDSENNLIDTVNGWSGGNNETKQTMERNGDMWQTSLQAGGTPRSENSSGETKNDEKEEIKEMEPINIPPVAEAGPDMDVLINQEIKFNGIDSLDMNGNRLTYFWNFGDGATDEGKIVSHIYPRPGQYIVNLTVNDGTYSDSDIAVINVFEKTIVINEIHPKENWIELFNQSETVSNLSGWKISNSNSSFTFPQGSVIAPNQFLVISEYISNLNLNQGPLSLFYPNGSLAEQIKYQEEEILGSICLDGNEYLWSNFSTPGSENMIRFENEYREIETAINNPRPVTQKENERTSLISNSNLTAQTKENDSNENIASLSQNVASLPKTELTNEPIKKKKNPENILILSIVISASLMLSWVLNMIRKTRVAH